MKKTAIAIFFFLLGAAPAAQSFREIKGMKVDEKMIFSGKELFLNGAGVRKKAIFNIYVMALYTPQKYSEGEKVVAAKESRAADLIFLRSVGGKTISEAIEKSFKNNASDFGSLKERLALFKTYIPDLSKGDRVRFLFLENGTLEILYNGEKKGEIKGRDFSETLLNVWLGPKPTDAGLKTALLGKTD